MIFPRALWPMVTLLAWWERLSILSVVKVFLNVPMHILKRSNVAAHLWEKSVKQEIKLVDLQRQFQTIRYEVLQALDESLCAMELFLGPQVRAFEREFADYCGAAEAIGVGSGTDALYLGLRACGIGAGDEVITVAN